MMLSVRSRVYPTAADSRRRFAARADDGFHRAAQYGLAAQLSWPAGGRDRIRALPAPQLVAELIPAAMQGLLTAGVVSAEAEGLFEVISQRRPGRRAPCGSVPRSPISSEDEIGTMRSQKCSGGISSMRTPLSRSIPGRSAIDRIGD